MFDVDVHLLKKSRVYQGAQDDDGGCKEGAHVFCTGFITWYNSVHRHSGIRYHALECTTA
jgi:hypothetical protein